MIVPYVNLGLYPVVPSQVIPSSVLEFGILPLSVYLGYGASISWLIMLQ